SHWIKYQPLGRLPSMTEELLLPEKVGQATIAKISAALAAAPSAALLTALATDPRKGVQQALRRYQRQQQATAELHAALQQELTRERQLWPPYPLIDRKSVV